MKYHPFFILMLLTLSACPERTDDMEKLDSRIYMAGSYREGNTQKACYWVNGKRINLDTPIGLDSQADSIVVKGGTVYVAGTYSDWNLLSLNYTACCWVNGKRTDLAVPEGVGYATANDIAVLETKVYIAGYYFSDDNYGVDSDSTVACYWINGERIDMVETGSRAYAIAVRNDTVYMTGVYQDGYMSKSCLWINGERTELDAPPDDYISYTRIYLLDDKVCMAGIIYNGDQAQACFWVDGMRTDLSIADIYHFELSVPAIAVSNGKLYTVGKYYSNSGKEKGYYSVDETVIPLNVPDDTTYVYVNDLAVLDGRVYTVGHYYIGGWASDGAGFHGYHAACYWVDGIKTDLSSEIEVYTITIAD